MKEWEQIVKAASKLSQADTIFPIN